MTNIPQKWVKPCNEMSEIWTGSEYSKKSFESSGVKVPIHILNHAIDVDLFANAEPWKIKNKRAFNFISVFDFSSRKNPWDLLRAYWTTFDDKDDVCLILKVFFGDFSDSSRADIIRRICNYRKSLKLQNRAPILIYGYEINGNNLPGLYRCADCYVGVSREGFGLTMAESMAAGLACIGPEVGGNREFMTPENSFLVKYLEDEPIAKEAVALDPDFEGLMWAKYSWEHLAEQMKLVVNNEKLRKEVALKGQEFVKKHLNYRAIGNRILELLEKGT